MVNADSDRMLKVYANAYQMLKEKLHEKNTTNYKKQNYCPLTETYFECFKKQILSISGPLGRGCLSVALDVG